MKIGILISIFAVLFTGCSLIMPRGGEVDPAQVERDIYNIAKASIILAIVKIHDDDVDEQIKSAGKIVASIDQFAMPILTNPEAQIDEDLVEQLLTLIPFEYQGLMLFAYQSFNSNYVFPTTTDVLPEPYIGYLRSFLKGVRDGAEQVLINHDVTLRVEVEAVRE